MENLESDNFAGNKMNSEKKASWVAVTASIAVSVAGAYILFILCSAFYEAFALEGRVFFPFILSPIIAAVGLWWLLTPYFIIRSYGPGALFSLIAAGIMAGAMFILFFLPQMWE